MTLYNLHYIAGLQDLGYDVHYVERQNYSDEYYDPSMDSMSLSVSIGLDYLRSALQIVRIDQDRSSLIDQSGNCHGSGWTALKQKLIRADFVLNIADPTWFDELSLCSRRAFIDGDPLFTQVAMMEGGLTGAALSHYPFLYTYCTRLGQSDCSVPTASRSWIPTRPVVATRLWLGARGKIAESLPMTTVMNWSAWADIVFEGRTYGQKGREMERLIDLPLRVERRFVIAMGGRAPREHLMERGWELVSALEVTRTIPAYRGFIAGSHADLGIAKHAYVASRCGWFSDRSLCYLASGRPVLHQDTGFTDWLQTGEGVFAFSDVDTAVAALDELDRDYGRHVRAAHGIAHEFFEARMVIGRMLDSAGFR
jgi:hypothetical protein